MANIYVKIVIEPVVLSFRLTLLALVLIQELQLFSSRCECVNLADKINRSFAHCAYVGHDWTPSSCSSASNSHYQSDRPDATDVEHYPTVLVISLIRHLDDGMHARLHSIWR